MKRPLVFGVIFLGAVFLGNVWSLFAACALAASEVEASPTLENALILEKDDPVRVVSHPAILLDPDASLTIKTLPRDASAFRPHSANLGYQSGAVWIRLAIRNHSENTLWWLEVGEPRLRQVTLYRPDGEGHWQRLSAGMGVPHDSKRLRERRNLFPLRLPPGEETLVYLRVESPTAIAVPIHLWQPAAFLRDEGAAKLFLGVLLGTFACIGFYYLIVFALLRDRVYAWFALMMAAHIMYLSAYQGLLHTMLSGWLVEWSLKFIVASASLLCYAIIGYSRRFLDLVSHAKNLDRLAAWLQWGLLILLLFSVLGSYTVAGPLVTLMVPVVAAFSLIIGAVTWRRGYRPARLYFMTFGLIWVAVVYGMVEIVGWVPVSLGNMGYSGIFLLVTPLLAAAFVDRQSLLQQDVNKAQQEKQAVQQDMLETLESRVAQRTHQARQAQQDAEQANQAKNDFLSTVTHELRTPLTTVLGVTDLLDDLHLNAREGQLVRAQRHASDHLLSLIDDILDMARLEQGGIDLTARVFEPRQVVDEVVAMLKPQADARGLALHAEITGQNVGQNVGQNTAPVVQVMGDADRLRQVLTNLVANGIKYTEQGGVILRAEARLTEQVVNLRLSIEDTGKGIDPAQLGEIFQPFFTVGNHREGSGLGLAISQRIVRQMGGWISAESQPGLGSSFTLELPFAIAHAPAPQPQTPESIKPLNILLVEDQPENRQIISQLISADGHQVSECGDGQSALDAFGAAEFDVVLMDRRLPDGDGVEFARAMSEQLGGQPEERRHTRLIMLTANATRDTLQRCREAGLDGLLSKPVRRERLRQVLAGEGAAPWDDQAEPVSVPMDAEQRTALEQRHQQTVREVIEMVEQAIAAKDFARIAHAVHRLAGSAALLGDHALADAARAAEVAADANDPEPARRLVTQLHTSLG